MKNKFLGFLGLFTLAVSLVSCGSEQPNSNSTGLYPNDSNQVDPNTGGDSSHSGNLTPEFVDPSFSVTDNSNPSPKTDVESTVEAVYDSVVSIEAYSNTALSRGSGVLFSYDEDLNLSFIVTCYHVINGADRYYVRLTDGSDYKASVVGAYMDKDLAVLSIEATGLTYASFYTNSDDLKLGSSVVCIGNPLGTLPGSVSSGIVSYINREIPVDEYNTMTLIQTDVAINSGNSGGGLFNTSGALIGIVNAKYASDGIEGLGFAIPINDVRKTVNDILATARYDKANKTWECGYVKGDYELAFKIETGYYTTGSFVNPQYVQVVYITDLVDKPYYSGCNKFQNQDVIKKVEVSYKDSSKKNVKLEKFNTAQEVLAFLNEAKLSIDDTIKFVVERDNRDVKIEFSIVQFRFTM